MKKLLTALALLAAADARGARQNILEVVEEALRGEDSRAAVMAALRARFADYGFKIVRDDRTDSNVVLHMIAEGTLDESSPERIADVAFAAFVAVSRGADPEVVEGVGLYGYRKKLPGERIAVWANGYNEATREGVPGEVAADLIRNAMEHDWDDHAFNTFKWSLVQAAQEGLDPRRYAAFMFQRMEQGGRGPGAITAEAIGEFRAAKKEGRQVPLPDYRGVFSIEKDEVKQAGKERPWTNEGRAKAEARRKAEEAARKAAEERSAREAEAKARRESAEQAVREAVEARERARQADADERVAARRAEREARKRAAREKKEAARFQREADRARKKSERAEREAAKARAADTSGAEAESAPVQSDAPPAATTAALQKVWPDLDRAVRSYLGTPYVWGGETKKGIDCSGLTKRSYKEGAQVGLPRLSREQWKSGEAVEEGRLQEGDLIFFNTMGNGVSHVGMVVEPGSGKFIHASSSRGVTEDLLKKTWFKKRYLGARRVLR